MQLCDGFVGDEVGAAVWSWRPHQVAHAAAANGVSRQLTHHCYDGTHWQELLRLPVPLVAATPAGAEAAPCWSRRAEERGARADNPPNMQRYGVLRAFYTHTCTHTHTGTYSERVEEMEGITQPCSNGPTNTEPRQEKPDKHPQFYQWYALRQGCTCSYTAGANI